MDSKDPFVLLVEDNPDDEALTRRAFQKHKSGSQIKLARDGAEALDFLFDQRAFAQRDVLHRPRTILLDLRLLKLERIRANDVTRALPLIIQTSSKEQEDSLRSYLPGAISYVRQPVDFKQFMGAVEPLGLFWLDLLELPW